MTLEATNQSKESTLGVIKNASLHIGPIEAHLQIQVINRAPFDLLLGHPFFCLLSSILRDFPDGEQSLEICDPNSGCQLLILTHPRHCLYQHPQFINPEDEAEYFACQECHCCLDIGEQGF
ncbi:hypothetical protein EDC04DRAFT_2579700 [Pisolithus marmoratus]|nr:hypothetical protein EDC04DRAFT_2579700 [Pisolithus marmoratus]